MRRNVLIGMLGSIAANQDPTRTISLRRAFIADSMRRFKELKAVIEASVVGQDIFQLSRTPMRERIAGLALEPANPNTFASLTPAERIAAFSLWLEEQEAAGILKVTQGGLWANKYIQSSYQRGLQKALTSLRAKGINVPATTLVGIGGVGGAFYAPFHQSRIQVLFTETFDGLSGITKAMNAQIRSVIAQGMAEGVGPEEMARRINGRVGKIGMTRSRLVARTESVKAFNVAQANEFKRAETIIGEDIFIQWWTAEDERVRSMHQLRHGRVYLNEDYLSLLGDPNCRCSGLPYVTSIDGQATLTSAAQQRIDELALEAKMKEEAAKRREEKRRQQVAA